MISHRISIRTSVCFNGLLTVVLKDKCTCIYTVCILFTWGVRCVEGRLRGDQVLRFQCDQFMIHFPYLSCLLLHKETHLKMSDLFPKVTRDYLNVYLLLD